MKPVNEKGGTLLTAELLRKLFEYDPATGALTWRKRTDVMPVWNARFAGAAAGTLHNSGYLRVGIANNYYLVHRLVWRYVHGTWPSCFLDHKDGDKTNNRISNLREADINQNRFNVPARSGYKGVWEENGKFRAEVVAYGNRYRLGTHNTPEAAYAAYCRMAEKVHGEFACNGAATENKTC